MLKVPLTMSEYLLGSADDVTSQFDKFHDELLGVIGERPLTVPGP
jgi:hypothetical protein